MISCKLLKPKNISFILLATSVALPGFGSDQGKAYAAPAKTKVSAVKTQEKKTPESKSSSGGAYRWTDPSGNEHFGSNPPANAENVVSLSGKKFSRYSADKLLQPYQRFTMPVEHVGAHGETLPKEELDAKSMRARMKAQKKGTEVDLTLPQEEDSLTSAVIAEKPVYSLNEKGEVSRCQVLVKNKSSIPVNGVTVRFEFEDGSLIPATGPQSIPPEGKATYLVPDEVLPIRVASKKPARSESEDEDSEAEETPENLNDELGSIPPQASIADPKVVIRVGTH